MKDLVNSENISKVWGCLKRMHFGISMFPFDWALNIQVADVHYWAQIGPFAIDFGWDEGDENI